MTRILFVEDDDNLRVALADNLREAGYQLVCAASCAAAFAALEGNAFDLVILDLMLPDGDGFTICRTLRQRGSVCPVLMLTARDREDDMVRGLDVGADDYLVKPYRLRELLARVRALLRRAPQPPGTDTLQCGPYRLDLRGRQVTHESGNLVILTKREFDLLAFLIEREGQAHSRQDILDNVWGRDIIIDDRTVDNFVSSLKKKLGWTPASSFRIATVRGIGYRLELVSASQPASPVPRR